MFYEWASPMNVVSGCSNKTIKTLQLIQNAAAHVLTRTKKRDHISPVMKLSANSFRKTSLTQSLLILKGILHRFSIQLCISRNPIVFLNDRASLPHVPLRREISAFGAWKKSSDDVK